MSRNIHEIIDSPLIHHRVYCILRFRLFVPIGQWLKKVRHSGLNLLFRLPGMQGRDSRVVLKTAEQVLEPVHSFASTNKGWTLPYNPQAHEFPLPTPRHEGLTKDQFEVIDKSSITPIRPTESQLIHVPHARVTRDGVVVTEVGEVLTDGLYEVELPGALSLPEFVNRHLRASIRLEGEYVHLGHQWAHNYYHWLIEILPRLQVLEAFPELQMLPILISHPKESFHGPTLAALGYGADRVQWLEAPGGQLDGVYHPTLFNHPYNATPANVEWLRRRCLGDRHPAQTRRLYITRRDASNRRIGNEEEIIQELERRGFESFCPGEHTFEEQVKAFSEAAVVAGPHGAGLANIVFARQPIDVIEIFPAERLKPWIFAEKSPFRSFLALAAASGHRHHFTVGSHSREGFVVDVPRLTGLVDAIKVIAA